MSKKDKKVRKKRKILSAKKLFICIVLLLIGILVYYVYSEFLSKPKTVTAPKVVDEIKNDKFNYVVNENDTKLFKSTFKELKDILSKKEVDNSKYAETVAKLFIIDFFSLDNKTSKNDVGGVQFVYNSFRTDFIDYARNSIYKQVSNTVEGGDKKNLPLVESVKVEKIDTIVPSSELSHSDFSEVTEPEAYEVSLSWTYKNGEGFQTSSTLIIVKDEAKLSVAKMTRE